MAALGQRVHLARVQVARVRVGAAQPGGAAASRRGTIASASEARDT